MDPPPPPPPHGTNAGNKSGLPPGNYDIFIIPPHSSGSGFLYLPSFQTNRNSFLAGVACTLAAVAIWTIVFPVLREWFATIVASGGMGVVILLIGVGVAGWAWGKTQMETGGSAKGGAAGGGPNTYANGSATGSTGEPAAGSFGGMPGASAGPTPGTGPRPPPPKPTWQRSNTTPNNASGTTGASAGAGAGNAKGGWEKAREETRKKEEDRRRAEELRKKREEDEKERVKQREKDAREREARERREKALREARERREKEGKEKLSDPPPPPPPPEEKTSPRKGETSRPSSPSKNHRQPTAKTATDDASSYSFRPYDKPKRPLHKTTSASSVYSESSYAPSQSTARTTPPPSHRGPYSTKDPDKIVIKGVYSFNNAFTKLPIAQLVSGMGSVTDGLILRITTEGLFIDDDVRGVPQREWDVKAWTMKLIEVWCPCLQALGASSGSGSTSRNPPPPPAAAAGRSTFFGMKGAAAKAPTPEETDALVERFLGACKSGCASRSGFSSSNARSDLRASQQSGEYKGLHVLRASIRDQEGKRYLFVLQEEEGWKVAVGLQRLRRGTQVRALGVSGMAPNETKAILEGMGWA